jgi:hypothetical protein
MDRLEAMSIFLAVVEAGSLSAAARRLNTPIGGTPESDFLFPITVLKILKSLPAADIVRRG